MKVSQFKPRPPWRLGEVLDGKSVHLYVEVPYHQITACGRVLYSDGYSGGSATRTLCKSCLRSLGYIERRGKKILRSSKKGVDTPPDSWHIGHTTKSGS